MKKTLLMTLAAGVMLLGQPQAYSQVMGPGAGMMSESGQEKQTEQQLREDMQQSMYRRMMKEYGPDWEMMGGYGMGMGPGMMGYGMGPGGMHRYGRKFDGMGPGMMGGYGYCQGPHHMWDYRSDEYDSFMNETKDTRKKLHDLQFEYSEMMRNPKTTIEELREAEKKIYELREELRKKALEK